MATKPERDKVTVVGEGLVGSLLAIHLSRRGFHVDVYERRPDMRKEAVEAGRSINLALSTRGLYALKEIGLDQEALKHAIPMRGRMIHSPEGRLSFQPYGKDDSEHINSISRAWLNRLLMDEAEKSSRVVIRFRQKALGMDFRTQMVRLKDEASGAVNEVRAEVVIAADGAGSAIRGDMVRLPGRAFSQSCLEHGYKELSIPSGPGEGDARFLLEKNALHIWPRGTYMLIALPNWEGSFTCTLFLPFEGRLSFDSLKGPAEVSAFFQEQFPDARRLMPRLAEEFFANPTGSMATVRCSPWNVEGKALLLGDAAHAMVPFYGQGMNCGFEDVTTLGRSLDRPGDGGWEKVFAEFSRTRKPDTDAIAEMAVENFIEMRDKVADPGFLLEKQVETLLQEKFPGDYIPRYSLVTFSRVPYRLAREAGLIEGRILEELCRGLGRARDVDLGKARTLIRERLSPLLNSPAMKEALPASPAR